MRAFKNNVFIRGENPIVVVEEKIKMKKTESEKRKTEKRPSMAFLDVIVKNKYYFVTRTDYTFQNRPI